MIRNWWLTATIILLNPLLFWLFAKSFDLESHGLRFFFVAILFELATLVLIRRYPVPTLTNVLTLILFSLALSHLFGLGALMGTQYFYDNQQFVLSSTIEDRLVYGLYWYTMHLLHVLQALVLVFSGPNYSGLFSDSQRGV